MDMNNIKFIRKFSSEGNNKLSIFRDILEPYQKDPKITFDFETYT